MTSEDADTPRTWELLGVGIAPAKYDGTAVHIEVGAGYSGGEDWRSAAGWFTDD